MKKVINVSLAGRSFTLEEDAYNRLTSYLEHYKARLTVTESQKEEVMEEMEGRIAELFYEETGAAGRVVTLSNVERVAAGPMKMPRAGPVPPLPQRKRCTGIPTTRRSPASAPVWPCTWMWM